MIVKHIRYSYPLSIGDYMRGVTLNHVRLNVWEVTHHLYTICKNAFNTHVCLMSTNFKRWIIPLPEKDHRKSSAYCSLSVTCPRCSVTDVLLDFMTPIIIVSCLPWVSNNYPPQNSCNVSQVKKTLSLHPASIPSVYHNDRITLGSHYNGIITNTSK